MVEDKTEIHKNQLNSHLIDDSKLKDIHDELHGVFDSVLQAVKADMEGSDLGRVVIRHNDLQNPIVVPLQPLEELNAGKIMETRESIDI